MPRYRVLIPWTNTDGEHQIGDIVECNPVAPVDHVELEKLINYGIIEPATETAEDQDESTPARTRAARK